MAKLYQIHCPKCNNNHSFYRYGKDKAGFQKYLCRKCGHQFAPDAPAGKPGKPAKAALGQNNTFKSLSGCFFLYAAAIFTSLALTLSRDFSGKNFYAY